MITHPLRPFSLATLSNWMDRIFLKPDNWILEQTKCCKTCEVSTRSFCSVQVIRPDLKEGEVDSTLGRKSKQKVHTEKIGVLGPDLQ